MNMKNKALLASLCAVSLVTASVMGTMAYLTSRDQVTNTFTVGSVAITLDEADVDNSTSGASRDQANAYNLLPGHTYSKDPTIHVDSTSEDCYVFVTVANGLASYEADSEANGGYQSIADQIQSNGWVAVTGYSGVYYQTYQKGSTAADYLVFSQFKIADNANAVQGWSSIGSGNNIVVTGYAVQMDGFASAADAWGATFGATV